MLRQTLVPKRHSTMNAGISLNRDLIKQLDELAGDVPRSRFVQRLVERALREHQELMKEEKEIRVRK
jgi:metal-responsive CopG/Arc/MetJ family transcriptional regulator